MILRAGEISPTQRHFEELICYGMEPQDDFVNYPEPPHVPLRFRNSYSECSNFVNSVGWTTNQFIEGLVFAFTNNITDAAWEDEERQRTAEMAVVTLGEIPDPAVTNYFRSVMDRDDLRGLQSLMITPMFQYTNLEPEVLDYIKTLCLRTNIYCYVSSSVANDIYETLSTMRDEFKGADTTNRVARFMYYSIFHTVRSMTYQDRMLAEFLPAYSNSLQRLEAMHYVATTATNELLRPLAQAEADRLERLGTNNLVNIEWIAE